MQCNYICLQITIYKYFLKCCAATTNIFIELFTINKKLLWKLLQEAVNLIVKPRICAWQTEQNDQDVCISYFDIDFLFINVNRFVLNHSRAFEMGSTVVYFRPLWLSIPLRSWRVNSWDGPVCRMQRGQKLLNNGLHSRALARREAKKGARSFSPHPGGGMPHCCCRARGPAAADIAVLHSATAVWMI